ncbi:MAG: 4-(cytidine 5'-diphospho)-2-C-methyl-D-erythritol kinase [Clostridiales bacterium]|nr:4-(cytidine 5'-diphospho)-2-C-methyl-D-erythritol kinase [Clostridiales bacterium]
MKLYEDMIITGSRAIAKSYAKINLTLDVLGRFENGYHEVKMIMQSVNLFDLVIVDRQKSGIKISTNRPFLPNNEQNIAYRAANLFFSETGIDGGVKIMIHKNIPVAAGLAGGSGNAAAVLCALNLLYSAHLPDSDLARMGLMLGADVPYCIFGGTYLAEGIGERLTRLPSLEGLPVVLVKPLEGISTAAIYNSIDSAHNLIHPNTDAVINALKSGDLDGIYLNLANIMENITADKCPEIAKIKKRLMEMGAKAAVMSGSGPTVFGIFPDNKTAKAALDSMSAEYDEAFLAHTIS